MGVDKIMDMLRAVRHNAGALGLCPELHDV